MHLINFFSPTKKTSLKTLFGAVALLSAFMWAGCSSSQNYEYGTKMEASQVAQIKKGVTTRAEVEALLGPPAMVSMYGGEGKRLMSYSYTSTSAEGHASAVNFIPIVGLFAGGAEGQAQIRTQTLQIVLNSSGVVEDYEFNDGATDTNTQGSGINGVQNMHTTSTSTTPTTSSN